MLSRRELFETPVGIFLHPKNWAFIFYLLFYTRENKYIMVVWLHWQPLLTAFWKLSQIVSTMSPICNVFTYMCTIPTHLYCLRAMNSLYKSHCWLLPCIIYLHFHWSYYFKQFLFSCLLHTPGSQGYNFLALFWSLEEDKNKFITFWSFGPKAALNETFTREHESEYQSVMVLCYGSFISVTAIYWLSIWDRSFHGRLS